MIEAVLVDDELHGLKTLQILLADYCPDVKIVAQCASAKKALEAIETLKPALVFLDIEMPFMNGFELLEQFEEIPFSVIFTTSYDQYAIRAIRFSALDYLLKPVDPRELIAAVGKVKKKKMPPSQQQFEILVSQLQHRENRLTKIAVPTAEGFELIPCDELLCCEADDNYTHLLLRNKTKIIASRTLKEMEEQLAAYSNFLRVHHSYVVNLNEVVKYVRGDGGYLVMTDGSTVNVSRSRKNALMKYF